MSWFPSTRDSSSNGWRFDIVGLLAVIGESSIAENVAITASSFSYVPRLIPAPQALCKTERRKRLPSAKDVDVYGVYGGTSISELNYFANAIHKIDELKEFEFREYTIEYQPWAREKKNNRVQKENQAKSVAGAKNTTKFTESDIEMVPRPTPSTTLAPSKAEEVPIHIRMKTFCALNIVTLGSVLMTIGLFVWAALIHDGVACMAIATISVSTSVACLSAQWRPQLNERPTNAPVVPGDIVIKTRGGAMVVVHCEEAITRELYMATEKCDYIIKSEKVWSFLVGLSTIMLMICVVLLGNCEWTMQAATGVAYIILNAAYWALPLFEHPTQKWDLAERFHIEENPHINPDGWNKAVVDDRFGNRPSYTRTLAYAIQATKDTDWVTRSKFAPAVESWEKWVNSVRENLADPGWDPVAAKDYYMAEASRKVEEAKAQQGRLYAQAVAGYSAAPGQFT